MATGLSVLSPVVTDDGTSATKLPFSVEMAKAGHSASRRVLVLRNPSS